MELIKASGEKESYSRSKYCDSLKAAGASQELIDKACDIVLKELKPEMSTEEVYEKTTEYLAKEDPAVAARYNVKRGLMQLGPAGFHFERFIEAILKSEGYQTERDIFLEGECVDHEIDVVARNGSEHFLLEMKYRNDQKTKTGIDVVMYAHARLLDIVPAQEKKERKVGTVLTLQSENRPPFARVAAKHQMWLVTNAKFTSKAIKYGKCRNLKMTGWNYPRGEKSLENIIKANGLYPITVLPSMNRFAREALAQHGIMLARDLTHYTSADLTKRFDIKKKISEKIVNEAQALFPQ